MPNTNKKRILTGDNPTGDLHIGHYVGSLQNRVSLQEEYETFIIIADMHAFAYPKYVENPKNVRDSVSKVLLGNLAAGMNPNKTTFFVESGIPEIYELSAILSMLVSHNRAMRNPTLKEEIIEKSMGDSYSLGFINFPVFQAADILCVKANLVPVGEDQLPHIELTRELARKFNQTYGEVFPEPEAKIGEVKRLIGLDGNAKMTKSLENTIYLNEKKDVLRKKIMSMYTDPSRIRATDPGKVEGNPVFIYHDIFNTNKKEVQELKNRYAKGDVGDVEVKEKLFLCMDSFLEPIRERYEKYESDIHTVNDILRDGTKKTREIVKETLAQVKEKMHFV